MKRFVTFLLAALLAGCAPVGKQESVRRIARAVDALGVRTGTIAVATRPLGDVVLPQVAAPARADAALPVATLRFAVDRKARRAALLAPPEVAARIGISTGASFPALVLFDRDRVYVRAPDAGLIGARPWLAMDLRELGAVAPPETDELARPRTLGDLVVVSPVQILDLALGVLTGSVKRPAAGTYRANTSIEKEFRQRRLDPSEADDFEQALRSFAVKDDINPITVLLDSAQGLSGVSVDFVGRPEYGVKFATQFAVVLDAATADVDRSVLRVPPRADVVQVSSLGDVRAAVDEWSLAEVAA